MNKLRQSLRRRKPAYVPEASRPHQWQADEDAVRKGTCSFPVRVSGQGVGGAVTHAGPSWMRSRPVWQRQRIHKEHSLSPSELGLKTSTLSLVPRKCHLGDVLLGSPCFVGVHNFQRALEGHKNFVSFAKPSVTLYNAHYTFI